MNYITWVISGNEWQGMCRAGMNWGTLPPLWWQRQLEDKS
jgi:hypothetical protein